MSSNYFALLWVSHCFCTFFMTGLIWIIQMVHYPSIRFIEPVRFREFHVFHSSKIRLLVGPAMLVELLSALFLYQNQLPKEVEPWMLGIVLLSASCWAFTGLVSARIHLQLSKGFDVTLVRRLVVTNWIRTYLWSVHSGVLIYCTVLLIRR
jgi:hypothetical protein